MRVEDEAGGTSAKKKLVIDADNYISRQEFPWCGGRKGRGVEATGEAGEAGKQAAKPQASTRAKQSSSFFFLVFFSEV
jgi:hypothetical protein